MFSLHVSCAGALFWGQFSTVTDVRFISAPAPAFPWTHDHMTDSSTTSTNPQWGWAHKAGTGGAARVPPTNIPPTSVTRYPRLQWTDPHTHTHSVGIPVPSHNISGYILNTPRACFPPVQMFKTVWITCVQWRTSCWIHVHEYWIFQMCLVSNLIMFLGHFQMHERVCSQ